MAVPFTLVFLSFTLRSEAQADLAVQIVAGPPGNVNIGSTIGVSVTVSISVLLPSTENELQP